jgi:hypothetical protein
VLKCLCKSRGILGCAEAKRTGSQVYRFSFVRRLIAVSRVSCTAIGDHRFAHFIEVILGVIAYFIQAVAVRRASGVFPKQLRTRMILELPSKH